MATKKAKSTAKASVAKRTLNGGGAKSKKSGGDPFNDQDSKRRLGNFTTAGEHARVGGRTSGIVGQTTKQSKTDKRTAKRSPKKAGQSAK